MSPFIYLDNSATTPLDPKVLESMMPYLTTHYGNASSLTHSPGRTASAAVELARNQIASLIHAKDPEELFFTSGSTESINTVIKGVYDHYQSIGSHFITCRTEHKAVLDTFDYIRKKGATVTYLDVDHQGRIDLKELEQSIRKDTVLISLMASNNETGVLHPIDDIAQIATKHQVLFFCDATQSAGKIPLDLDKSPIDILCMSSHKMYGPKGIGALYVRKKNKRIQIGSLLHGGKQENNRRAGTLNVPAIVGFGKAAELSTATMRDDMIRLEKMRNLLEDDLLNLPQTRINGYEAPRLPHITNVTFRHVKATEIMIRLPELGMATGSACVSGLRDPSHVLTAMGINKEDAFSTLRISLGRYHTQHEIQLAIDLIKNAVLELRDSSPSWQLFQKGLIE